jgi:hypothetical protein
MSENLQELFAAPLNPKLVAVLDKNTKFYSSNYLISEYKKSLAKSEYTAKAYSLLNNLINDKIIIPVYMSSNILTYSFYKIFKDSNPVSNALAFYDPASNRIFVLIDKNTTLGFVSNEWIAKLTVHELMHMSCAHGKDRFKKLFFNDYQDYYSYFFHILCEKDTTNKTMKDISPFVKEYINIFHNVEVHNGNLETAIIKKGFNIFYKIMKYFNIEENTIKDTQDGYKYLLIMYLKYGVPGIIKAISYKECKNLILSLKNTYYFMTRKKIQTLAIQELIFPSEVVAVLSETGYVNNKIPSAIKMIKHK